MGKKKTRVILVLLVFILVMATEVSCKKQFLTGAEKIGKQTKEAFDSIKTVSPDKEREIKWVDVDEEDAPAVEKEGTGSSQPEDVSDLENYKEGNISLKGKISSPTEGIVELNIDYETGTVEGSIKGMGWTEEIITDNEGSSSEDHHHTRNCEVIFNGTFFGKIDKNGSIFANVVGILNGKDGECSQSVKDKPESFTLSGKYYDTSNNASGSVRPGGYNWSADKV